MNFVWFLQVWFNNRNCKEKKEGKKEKRENSGNLVDPFGNDWLEVLQSNDVTPKLDVPNLATTEISSPIECAVPSGT